MIRVWFERDQWVVCRVFAKGHHHKLWLTTGVVGVNPARRAPSAVSSVPAKGICIIIHSLNVTFDLLACLVCRGYLCLVGSSNFPILRFLINFLWSWAESQVGMGILLGDDLQKATNRLVPTIWTSQQIFRFLVNDIRCSVLNKENVVHYYWGFVVLTYWHRIVWLHCLWIIILARKHFFAQKVNTELALAVSDSVPYVSHNNSKACLQQIHDYKASLRMVGLFRSFSDDFCACTCQHTEWQRMLIDFIDPNALVAMRSKWLVFESLLKSSCH